MTVEKESLPDLLHFLYDIEDIISKQQTAEPPEGGRASDWDYENTPHTKVPDDAIWSITARGAKWWQRPSSTKGSKLKEKQQQIASGVKVGSNEDLFVPIGEGYEHEEEVLDELDQEKYHIPRFKVTGDEAFDSMLEATDTKVADSINVDDLSEEAKKVFATKDDSNHILIIHSGSNFKTVEGVDEDEARTLYQLEMMIDGHWFPEREGDPPPWVKDDENPFPDIPDSVTELHIIDIPGWYKPSNSIDNKSGKPPGWGKARLEKKLGSRLATRLVQAAKTRVAGGMGYKGDSRFSVLPSSEILSSIFAPVENIAAHVEDTVKAHSWKAGLAKGIGTVTAGEIKKAQDALRTVTRKSLQERGLPQTFYVYRGGKIKGDEDTPTSVSLDITTAEIFREGDPGSGKAGITGDYVLTMYEVDRDDILLDMNALLWWTEGGEETRTKEEEFIVRAGSLRKPRTILLPEVATTTGKSAFHTLDDLTKSNDRVALTTLIFKQQEAPTPDTGRGSAWDYTSSHTTQPEDATIYVTSGGTEWWRRGAETSSAQRKFLPPLPNTLFPDSRIPRPISAREAAKAAFVSHQDEWRERLVDSSTPEYEQLGVVMDHLIDKEWSLARELGYFDKDEATYDQFIANNFLSGRQGKLLFAKDTLYGQTWNRPPEYALQRGYRPETLKNRDYISPAAIRSPDRRRPPWNLLW